MNVRDMAWMMESVNLRAAGKYHYAAHHMGASTTRLIELPVGCNMLNSDILGNTGVLCMLTLPNASC